jgi:MFS family permease
MHVDGRSRWLFWLSLCEIGTMLVFYNYSAVLPIIQKEWSLTNSQAGWIYSSYQIGYILAVVFLTSLTDYVNPKYVYISTAFWAGISCVSFSFLAEGFRSALIFRTLTGMGLAGTYMPGLRMVSEKFSPHERGKAVGIYVAAFTLGGSLSIFLTGFLTSLFSWRWAFLITSLGPIAGGVIAFFRLGENVEEKTVGEGKVSFGQVIRHRPALIMIVGYVGHMWEMFGMRGWMVAFLTACLLTTEHGFSKAVSLSAFIVGWINLVGAASNALGGLLSDRFGRANTIIVIMLGSSLISLLFGWTRTSPFWLVLTLSLLYGFMVTAESSVLSTGITELALPGGLGRTMALQSLSGFGVASLSPIVFGFILDTTNPPDALARYGYFPNWGWAFVILGIGGLMGALVIWRMKKEVTY